MTRPKQNFPKVSEVISIVAHQLKNPLSVIKGYLEVLISEELGKLNREQLEYLSDAMKNIERMRSILNHHLDISKIEEGRYEIDLKPVDLEKVVVQVIGDFFNLARASNSQIIFKKTKGIPKVLADLAKVRFVVENIIYNSLKYKSAGQGQIVVSLAKKGKKVLFSCQDNGIGIPKKDFLKVFGKFYRSEQAVELDPSGSGLGLYINRAIINLSGGEIWFKPNKRKGVTFYFTLPVAKQL